MKRWITRIAICLILGVVTTVAVAWGSILLPYNTYSQTDDTLQDLAAIAFEGPVSQRVCFVRDMPVTVGAGERNGDNLVIRIARLKLSVLMVNATSQRDLVEAPIHFVLPEDHQKASRTHFTWIDRCGWPCPAMIAHFRAELAAGGIDTTQGSGIDLGRGDRWFERRVLPTGVILPGFLINTLFYCAAWLVPFFGLGALRRIIRQKRGRCPRCGYDLRGNVASGQDTCATGCPECGWNRSEPRP